MKRWLIVGVLALIVVLAACGKSSSKPKESDTDTPPVVVPTRPPSPRDRPLPSGDPYMFEAPFSVGQFVRDSSRGHATADRTGGLQAIYTQGTNTIVLNVYYFKTQEQAVDTVRFALESATITQEVATPVYRPYLSYGVAQDRHGAYIVAWSREGWAFLARSSSSLDALNAFLDVFPY